MAKTTEVSLKADILNFLEKNIHINKLRFNFKNYNIYPGAYKVLVHHAIENEDIEIEIHTDLDNETAASYQSRHLIFSDDRIKLRPEFSIKLAGHQAILIHECTHAYTDLLNMGTHSRWEDEALAYIAQYIFELSSKNMTPILRKRLYGFRKYGCDIAANILTGSQNVPLKDAERLIRFIRMSPGYRNSPKDTVVSDGV